MMGIKRVLIKPDEKKVSVGGVAIPHSQAEKSMRGEIVLASTGADSPLNVDIGEYWLYDPAEAIEIEGGFVILPIGGLLAKFETKK